jgi:hypothetical protein
MSQTPVAMTFVHHANQLVIGNGYADRDGITRICHGYTAVLELHRGYRVPAALHLSGTLIEALAWHHPEFLATVRAALTEGWLTLVGGTYAEPIMPLASPEANRRQVATMASLLQRHLGVPGGALPTAWLPERVWDPDLLAVLTDPDLPGGGFRRVLVDERVLASPTTAGDGAGDRASVDRRGPYAWANGIPPGQRVTGLADPALAQPRRVGGPSPLVLVPISAHLRYLVPPPPGIPVQLLEQFVADLRARAAAPAAVLLCYGDDLERAAGVAGWRPAQDRYAAVLRWVADSPLVRAVCLDQWLDEHPASLGPTPAAGTYYELAVTWAAGEATVPGRITPPGGPTPQRSRRSRPTSTRHGARPRAGVLTSACWPSPTGSRWWVRTRPPGGTVTAPVTAELSLHGCGRRPPMPAPPDRSSQPPDGPKTSPARPAL